MMQRYDKKIIAKARRLYARDVSLREICKKTGIKSTSTILFQCSPKYRKKMVDAGKRWRKENPDRWNEICRKAARARLRRIAHGKNK